MTGIGIDVRYQEGREDHFIRRRIDELIAEIRGLADVASIAGPPGRDRERQVGGGDVPGVE